MSERSGIITFKGDPLTLVGEEIDVGDSMPDVTLVTPDLEEVKLSDFAGQKIVLSVVPSLDTPVCSTQTRTFNEKATSLGGDVVVLTVSMDLPFAQKRWCGAEGIQNVRTLSDYRYREFGAKFGLLIKELQLLSRAVLVVDSGGTIRYVQIVSEVTNEPDYDAAVEAVESL
jgi:thiol peroxidase